MPMPDTIPQTNRSSHGSRNLFILCAGAILIALFMTGLSLFIYWRSGDIYLDRSRPGYLPDEEEAAQDTPSETNYTFPDNGELTAQDLDEYLTQLQGAIDYLEDLPDPYSATPLSDESLGISAGDSP